MIYIASPYSSPILGVPEARFAAVSQFTLLCLQEGLPAFSPIVYFHPFSQSGGLPTHEAYWHNTNMQFLRRAEAVFALHLLGWENSAGMKSELKTAKILAIPVVEYGPDFKVIQ